MNFEFFLTRRLAFSSQKSFSRFIVRVAIVAVTLSLSVMIIATSMVRGFQKEISEKVFGFWGHIHISQYQIFQHHDEMPVSMHREFYHTIAQHEGIRHIQVYANKAGIIKTADEIEGVVLKGIGSDFDWDQFRRFIVDGDVFEVTDTGRSNNILISEYTAKRLRLNAGDDLVIYFIQQPPRVRKLNISGIYKSGMEEFDRYYALIDIKHIQALNDWEEDQVSGFEVFVDDVRKIDEVGDYLFDYLDHDLYAETIMQKIPNIFDWLQLQNTNELVILILMALVAAINIITVLLILILERTNMIGMLKAMGATDWSIRKVFIFNSAYITTIGIICGNVIGIGICLLQQRYEIIRLPEESYYVSAAPIDLDPLIIIMLNIATLIICIIAVLGPTLLVNRINPVRAIRFR